MLLFDHLQLNRQYFISFVKSLLSPLLLLFFLLFLVFYVSGVKFGVHHVLLKMKMKKYLNINLQHSFASPSTGGSSHIKFLVRETLGSLYAVHQRLAGTFSQAFIQQIISVVAPFLLSVYSLCRSFFGVFFHRFPVSLRFLLNIKCALKLVIEKVFIFAGLGPFLTINAFQRVVVLCIFSQKPVNPCFPIRRKFAHRIRSLT